MSESKHTKGEWMVNMWGIIYSKELSEKLHDEIRIGLVYMSDLSVDEYSANASLITAAPDMLAALERASRVISNFMLDHSDTPSCDAIEQIQSAIKKAKGRL